MSEVVWPAQRGAPRKLPWDTTALDTERPNTYVRVAWLLRANRLASEYGAVTAARWRKVLDLPEEVNSDPTLSRLESGRGPVSTTILNRYESLLGMHPGTLRGVTDAMCRALDPASLPSRQATVTPYSIDVLDERIAAGVATGADWLTLTDLLASPGADHLPGRVVEEWVAALAFEFSRSSGEEYATRLEALCAFVASPRYTHRAERVIREVADLPGNPHVAELYDVLGDSVRPGIVEDLTREFVRSSGRRLWGMTLALTCHMGYGSVSPQDEALIRRAAKQRASEPACAELARQLVHALDLRHREPVRERGLDGHLRNAPGLRTYLDAVRESGAPEDQMLQRLLQEALTTVFLERTHHSQMLILVSPYRRVIADTALDIMTAPQRTEAERRAAGRLVGTLADETHHARLISLAYDSGVAGVAARRALLNQRTRPSGIPDGLDDGRWNGHSVARGWWREHGIRPDDLERARQVQ
ncbi:hypothetical protein G9U51_10390 [Calidifontibacter sp. DB0510]|uniref:Uncharacterized protein n=1 Tax=Metallococcus carri TaxID=1656884 RepID=A0A967B2Q2_9MICO|nr:hypothetical protein [Metallococcus carri]NHN56185.1 hypothetical protein [Metallococcus carri]NOP38764.1 hypothetical protein [Calidifontibacter sp. DB2511S]